MDLRKPIRRERTSPKELNKEQSDSTLERRVHLSISEVSKIQLLCFVRYHLIHIKIREAITDNSYYHFSDPALPL